MRDLILLGFFLSFFLISCSKDTTEPVKDLSEIILEENPILFKYELRIRSNLEQNIRGLYSYNEINSQWYNWRKYLHLIVRSNDEIITDTISFQIDSIITQWNESIISVSLYAESTNIPLDKIIFNKEYTLKEVYKKKKIVSFSKEGFKEIQ